jgi:hypothetical protein
MAWTRREAEIDEPPAHDTVNRRDWTLVDHLRERRPMGVFELRRLAWRLLVDETVGAVGVELHDPVTHDLQRHAADFRSLGACCPIIGPQPKPTGVSPAARFWSCGRSCVIAMHRNRSGAELAWRISSFAIPNQIRRLSGIPSRVIIPGNWYKIAASSAIYLVRFSILK